MRFNISGKLAEDIAAFCLMCKGYKIVARNYVTGRGTRAGEIDIIAAKGKTLIFVEVKKRRRAEQAAYAVLVHQRHRVSRAAEVFVKYHPQYQNYDIRFDAFLVSLIPPRLKHLINAW